MQMIGAYDVLFHKARAVPGPGCGGLEVSTIIFAASIMRRFKRIRPSGAIRPAPAKGLP
jgi:hypothetical protein